MKKTIITTLCLLFISVASYAQENNERYEYCTFRINQGFSTGAVTTDFVMKAGLLDGDLVDACREHLFTKDIIFDVKFIPNGDTEIIRVYHLEELAPEDLKLLFVEGAKTEEFALEPSRFYKMDATSED